MSKTLIERLINRVVPLDRDYKALIRAKTEYLKSRKAYFDEQTRLQREENERIEAAANHATSIGIYTGSCVYNTNGKQESIDIDLILKETSRSRQIEMVARWRGGGKITSSDLNKSLWTFVEAQSFWSAWLHPWLEGTLEVKALRKLDSFRLIGEKVKADEDA